MKEFQIDIWRSDFIHDKYIKSTATNPLYGPFKPVLPENSFIGGALEKSVPPSPWAKGLMDWETDAVRRKRGSAGPGVGFDGGEEASGAGGGLLTPGDHYLLRHQRKQRKAIPQVMMGLKTMREERLRKEAELLQRGEGRREEEGEGQKVGQGVVSLNEGAG